MKCSENNCINPPAKSRKVCVKCYSRLAREKDRVRFALYMIKKSAKKRNLPFELELEPFREFVNKFGYIENKGRFSNQMTIDRIIPELGYIMDNIQVISKRENVQKYHAEEKNCFAQHDGDVPF